MSDKIETSPTHDPKFCVLCRSGGHVAAPGNPASDSARPCPAQHPDTAESCRFAYGHHGTLHRSAPGREWRQAVSVDFTAPSSPVAVPPSDQGHRSDPHISENGSCRCNCPKCMTGKVCICPACHSPFHDHDPRRVAVPPAEATPWEPAGKAKIAAEEMRGDMAVAIARALNDSDYGDLIPLEFMPFVAGIAADAASRLVPSSSQTPAEPTRTPVSLELAPEPPTQLGAGTPEVPEAAARPTEAVYLEAARAVLCGPHAEQFGEPDEFAISTTAKDPWHRRVVDAVWAAALSHVQEETAAAEATP